MKVRSIIICLATLIAVQGLAQQKAYRLDYIKRFKDMAISEMERTGVPASIKLAQGILESDAGRSTLARKANNHFGIKCGSQWDGKTYYREDDDYDEFGNLMKSCFRVYRNSDASYVAHSEFLTDPRKDYRYGFLFRLDPRDYEEWAYGLKRAGYATNPNYPQLLIGLIETYNLDQFDSGSSLIEPLPGDGGPPLLAGSGIFLVNDVKTILSEAGDTPDKIANRTGISVNRILRYNEKLDSKGEAIAEETRVFLQRKRNFFRGREKWHNVEEGETMFSISQLYGMRVEKLYKKNRMQPGTEPAIGERIKLRWRVRKNEVPRLRSNIKPVRENVPINGDELEMDDSNPIEVGEDFPFPNVTGNGNDNSSTPPVEDPYSGEVVTPPNNNPTNNNNNNTSTGNSTGNSGIKLDPVTTTPPPSNNTSTNPTTTVPPANSDTGIVIPEVTDIEETAPANAEFHKVKRGETLWAISRKYGIKVDDIKKMNNLKSDLIRSGWLLRVR